MFKNLLLLPKRLTCQGSNSTSKGLKTIGQLCATVLCPPELINPGFMCNSPSRTSPIQVAWNTKSCFPVETSPNARVFEQLHPTSSQSIAGRQPSSWGMSRWFLDPVKQFGRSSITKFWIRSFLCFVYLFPAGGLPRGGDVSAEEG